MAYIPSKVICDVCGEELPRRVEGSRFVKYYGIYYYELPEPGILGRKKDVQRVDVCPECYERVVRFVKALLKEKEHGEK